MICMRRSIVIITLVALLVPPVIQNISSQETGSEYPSTAPGVLDFREHDFASDGIVELNGEWLIFWNQLVGPGSPADERIEMLRERSDGSFRIPRTWNNWRHKGQPVGGHGYATFVTDLYLPQSMNRAALWIPNASTAYTLWVDGQVVSRSGTPGVDRSTSRPRYVVRTANFPVAENPVRLVLQVSNFHHRRGGMWKAVKLGTPDQIGTLDMHETVYDLLLLGSFIALGLFNLFLYLNQRRRSDAYGREPAQNPISAASSVPLLLAITFLAMTARVLVTGQIILTRLIPAFPWTLQLRIEYVSAMVVLALFSQIAARAYPNVIPRIVIRGILVFVIANAAVALLFPVNVYSRIVTSYNVTKSIALLGITVVFLLHAARGRRDTWPMVGAIIIFLLITLGETLHYREVILSRDFAPVGFIVSLLFTDTGNATLIYLVSTLGTLVVMLVVFNWFAVRVSLAFLQVGSERGELDWSKLVERYGVSPRELEILRLVARGMSNKEIGATLFISEGTVKNHLYRIMRKTGTGNRTEIVSRLTVSTAGAEMPH
jgi:DNA-binding CsgD family transcriptional regulator